MIIGVLFRGDKSADQCPQVFIATGQAKRSCVRPVPSAGWPALVYGPKPSPTLNHAPAGASSKHRGRLPFTARHHGPPAEDPLLPEVLAQQRAGGESASALPRCTRFVAASA